MINRGREIQWVSALQVENSANALHLSPPLPWGCAPRFIMNPNPTKTRRQGKSKRQGRKASSTKVPKQPVRMSGSSVTHTIDSFLPVFPNMTVRKLRYCTGNVITATAGVLVSHVFSLSGLYDPDITGTGHQPMGFDQIMPFYEHYHVLHCNAHVTFTNKQSAYRGYVALKITPDTALPTSSDDLVEEGRAVVDPIGGANDAFNGTKVLKASVNVPAINGLTRANYLADTSSEGTIASNPTEQTYLHVACWSPAGQNLDVEFNVVLEYTAAFTEPRNLTSSATILGDRALRKRVGELKI